MTTTVSFSMIKGNNNSNITVNQTENGNYSIVGTIYDVQGATAKVRRNGRIESTDISERFGGHTIVLVCTKQQANIFLEEASKYFHFIGSNPNIGFTIQVPKLPLPTNGIDSKGNHTKNILVTGRIDFIGVEEPDTILNEDDVIEDLDTAFELSNTRNKQAKQNAINNRLQSFASKVINNKSLTN